MIRAPDPLAEFVAVRAGETSERAEWDGYREQFKALVERKMYALAAKYEGAPRGLRRHFFDRQMDLLMQWRAGLEQPAERRS